MGLAERELNTRPAGQSPAIEEQHRRLHPRRGSGGSHEAAEADDVTHRYRAAAVQQLEGYRTPPEVTKSRL
eukprot:SAG31_NODE_1034_length_10228_cov_89.107316_1_plen_71_part_00